MENNYRDELCVLYHDQLVTFWLQAIFLKISFLLIEWKESTATGTSVVAEKILYEVALFCIWFYQETVLLGIGGWCGPLQAGSMIERGLCFLSKSDGSFRLYVKVCNLCPLHNSETCLVQQSLTKDICKQFTFSWFNRMRIRNRKWKTEVYIWFK